MPMHIPSNIDTDSSSIETVHSKAGLIASPLSPATQSDIMRILQREQDHAMSLLTLSPLLSSLFISYADRAAALEAASTTPSAESEEWKALQATIVTLQEEIEKLTSENLDMTGRLEASAASHEAFRSQVSSLKDANTAQQDDIKSLRAKLVEAKDKYDRLIVDSNAERAALQVQVLDLEAQRGELKETVVGQQIKISRLERQRSGISSNFPKVPPFTAADPRDFDIPEDGNTTSMIPTPSRSDNEYLMVTERGSPQTEPASPVFIPGPIPQAMRSITPEPLELPKEVKDGISVTSKHLTTPSLAPDRQSYTPSPLLATVGSEKRSTLPPPEPLVVSSLPQTTVKPVSKPVLTPARAPQKSGDRNSWGSSFLNNNIASAVAAPSRSPSPEPFLKPKIEDPPRGIVPNRPLQSQPAGFGSLNKPALGGGGSLDNSSLGAPESPWPPLDEQKKPAGPTWGAKMPSSLVSIRERIDSASGLDIPEDMIKTPGKSGGFPSPRQENEPAIPVETEDGFYWACSSKKSQAAIVAQTPLVLNTPDPDDAYSGTSGGGLKKKKKKGGVMVPRISGALQGGGL